MVVTMNNTDKRAKCTLTIHYDKLGFRPGQVQSECRMFDLISGGMFAYRNEPGKDIVDFEVDPRVFRILANFDPEYDF